MNEQTTDSVAPFLLSFIAIPLLSFTLTNSFYPHGHIILFKTNLKINKIKTIYNMFLYIYNLDTWHKRAIVYLYVNILIIVMHI